MPKTPAVALEATVVGYAARDGRHYPTLRLEGDAPPPGSALRVTLANGVAYATTVHDLLDTLEGVRVVTTGLEPIPAT